MKALLTILSFLLLGSCKKESNPPTVDLNGRWSVVTYNVSYYDASGNLLSNYNHLPALRSIIVENDSLTFDNSTDPVASPYTSNQSLSESNLVTLPVNFVSFNTKSIDGKMFLYWVTANEINNSHFEIQRRSSIEHEFEEIGRVAGANQANSYSLNIEDNLLGDYYFRLKQVDFGGNFNYSTIIYVSFKKLKIPVKSQGGSTLVDLPTAFAPFKSAEIKRISGSSITIVGKQNTVTYTSGSTVSTADHAEFRITLKK